LGLALLLALCAVLWLARHKIGNIAVPQDVRPIPSGAFGVGARTIELTLPNAPHATTLIDLWYPTEPTAMNSCDAEPCRKPSTPDRHGAASTSAPSVSTTGPPRPVVFYAPGWGGPRDDNTYALATLASQGYVVVAINDVGFDAQSKSQIPGRDPREVANFDWSTEPALTRSIAIANWRLHQMTDRLTSALDWLTREQHGRIAGLQNARLNVSQVGVLGFSIGGSAAAEVTRRDPRFVAAINMDGWLFGESAEGGVDRPLLTLNSDYPLLQQAAKSSLPATRLPAQLTIKDRDAQLRQSLRQNSPALIFDSVEHTEFIDDLFVTRLADYVRRRHRSGADRLRLRETIDALTLSFFDAHVRRNGASWPSVGSLPEYPGVKHLAQ
jgi:predicted dienelactone hydrolase